MGLLKDVLSCQGSTDFSFGIWKFSFGIAAHLATSGLTAPAVEAWTQARRDEAARLSGQRSPSEKTWALILAKLERSKAA